MQKAVIKSAVTFVSIVLFAACSGTGLHHNTSASVIHALMNAPLEFVDESSHKVWEGDIEGKLVTFFKTDHNSNPKDVVVVTDDQLPMYYRSVEYCDIGGDTNLDQVNIKMYKQGQGWSDLVIGSATKSTLGRANMQYLKLIGKINYRRSGYTSE